MRKLKEMFRIIDCENIALEEPSIVYTDMDGLYIKLSNCQPVIFIKKSLLSDTKKYKSILGEELGHHFTTTGDLTIEPKNYQEKLYKNKKEHLARKWAANFCISDNEFVQALNNCISSIPEMSEHFNVTEEVINYKISSIISDELKYINIRTAFMEREIPYNSCAI